MKKLILSILITTILSPVFELHASKVNLGEDVSASILSKRSSDRNGNGSSSDRKRTRVRIRGRR